MIKINRKITKAATNLTRFRVEALFQQFWQVVQQKT